ncbi:MAG: methyltransferase domain-containing protein [Acidobacteria bacterium]|nr:methyltransferase domain-containing protein [Acidobacteriota bacterium]
MDFFKKEAAPEAPPGNPRVELHRTLGLKEFLARLEGKGKVHLLDLGPALEENILYLAGRNCKVYVQDFFFELQQARLQHPPDEPFPFARFLETAFPYADNTFDAVLAWDMFNYLAPKEGTALAKKLFSQMKIGGLLFALFSSARTIANEPLEYRIVDASNLHYDIHRVERVSAPNFTNNEIARMMDRFAVVNFYFLRNGVREALLAKK